SVTEEKATLTSLSYRETLSINGLRISTFALAMALDRGSANPLSLSVSDFNLQRLARNPAPAFLLAISATPRQRFDLFGISIRAPGKFAMALMSDPHLPKPPSRCPP